MDPIDRLLSSQMPSMDYDPVDSLINQSLSLSPPPRRRRQRRQSSSLSVDAPDIRDGQGFPISPKDPSIPQSVWDTTIDLLDRSGTLGAINWAAGILNKPGRAVRGDIGARLAAVGLADHLDAADSHREILNIIPYSDKAGLTNPENEVRGYDILSPFGLSPKKPEGFWEHVPGFVAEVALDPLTYLGGVGLLGRAGVAGKALKKAGKLDEALSQARYYDDAGKVKLSPQTGKVGGRSMGPREKLVSTRPKDLSYEHQQIILDDLAKNLSPEEAQKAWSAIKDEPLGSMFRTDIPFVSPYSKYSKGRTSKSRQVGDARVSRLHDESLDSFLGKDGGRRLARGMDTASDYMLRKNIVGQKGHQFFSRASGGLKGYMPQTLSRFIHSRTRDLEADAKIDLNKIAGDRFTKIENELQDAIRPFSLRPDENNLRSMSISQKSRLEDVWTQVGKFVEDNPSMENLVFSKNIRQDLAEASKKLDELKGPKTKEQKQALDQIAKWQNEIVDINKEILDTSMHRVLMTIMELKIKHPTKTSMDEAYDALLGAESKTPEFESFRRATDAEMSELADSLISHKDSMFNVARDMGYKQSELGSMGVEQAPRYRDSKRYVRESLSDITDRMLRKMKTLNIRKKDSFSSARVDELRNLPQFVIEELFKDRQVASLLRSFKIHRKKYKDTGSAYHAERMQAAIDEFKTRVINSKEDGGLGYSEFFKTFDERFDDILEGVGEEKALQKRQLEIDYLTSQKLIDDGADEADIARALNDKYNPDKNLRELFSYMLDKGSLKNRVGGIYDENLGNAFIKYHVDGMTKIKNLEGAYEFLRLHVLDSADASPDDIPIYKVLDSVDKSVLDTNKAATHFGRKYLGMAGDFKNQLENLYVPKEVAEALQSQLSMTIKREDWYEDFWQLWDRIAKNPFEKGVTQPFPAYWNRNRIGGMWLNWISGHIKNAADAKEYLKWTKLFKQWAVSREIPQEIIDATESVTPAKDMRRGLADSFAAEQAQELADVRNTNFKSRSGEQKMGPQSELTQYGVFDPTREGRVLYEGIEGRTLPEEEFLPRPAIPGVVDTQSEDLLGGVLSGSPRQMVSGLGSMAKAPFNLSRWGEAFGPRTGSLGKSWKEAQESFAEKDPSMFQPGGGPDWFRQDVPDGMTSEFIDPMDPENLLRPNALSAMDNAGDFLRQSKFNFGDAIGSTVPQTRPGIEQLQRVTGPAEELVRNVASTAVNFGQKQSDWVEFLNRGPMYFYLKSKGFSPRAAAQEVRKLQIDYSNQSSFEKEVVRRLIPFYSFQRNVGPMLVENLLDKPGGLQGKVILATGREGDKDQVLPDYISQTAAIPLDSGNPEINRFLTGFGLPHEELLGIYRPGHTSSETAIGTGMELFGKLNPFLKGPAELVANKQFFSGRSLSDIDGPLDTILRNVGAIDQKNVSRQREPFEHLISSSPLSRLFSTGKKLTDANRWNSVNSVSTNALNMLTGIRVSDVNLKREKQQFLRDKLLAELIDAQGVGMMTRPYVRPDREATAESKAYVELFNRLKETD